MDPAQPYRVAHISDLHFSHITWNPFQFFSKQWVGNWNLILRRQREFAPEMLFPSLIERLVEEKTNLVLISGDLSCTSSQREFTRAADFVQKIQSFGIEVATLPGNHDHYTRSSYRDKTFYEYFNSQFCTEPITQTFSLREDKVALKHLQGSWWLVLLDTAYATSLFACHGKFSEEIESTLIKALSLLPDKAHVIVANHFPIFTIDRAQKYLLRDDALKQLLQRHPKVKLYVHGHTHRHCIADLRNARLPVILDAGSAAHKYHGSWNLIECHPSSCQVGVFKWQENEHKSKSWVKNSTASFEW